MPELPEVETVRRGLAPHLAGQALKGARVRQPSLRWPVPTDLDRRLRHRRVVGLSRRGKYLLLHLDRGHLLVHLGMSGSLRLIQATDPPGPHDHLDVLLENGLALRFRDPRRFGAVLWCETPSAHPLLAPLGLEPLETDFDGDWLHRTTRGRRAPIKTLLMDAHLIVGIGNIYANEALFHAGIHPLCPAGRLSRSRYAKLAEAIKRTLEAAIRAGGSSLRDFVDGHGNPGYFQQTYYVYGRQGKPCRNCGNTIRLLRHSGRATYFCPTCQPR